jgi:exoribonuclease-2
LRKKRLEQGALILSLPELTFHIKSGSSISLEMIPQDTPSRMMVAELMILYNWLAARFCRDNNIPILFRGQKNPSEILPIDERGYIYYVFRQRRKLHPLIIDTKPSPHTGLGLDVYTNLTSPIRRYLDLIVQRQIRDFLYNSPLRYNMENLEKTRLSVVESLRDLNIIKRNRTRYWILKYLSLNLKKNYPAIVLDVMKNKYRMILTDFLFTVEMKKGKDQNFSEGQNVLLKVKKSDPWSDSLILEWAG